MYQVRALSHRLTTDFPFRCFCVWWFFSSLFPFILCLSRTFLCDAKYSSTFACIFVFAFMKCIMRKGATKEEQRKQQDAKWESVQRRSIGFFFIPDCAASFGLCNVTMYTFSIFNFDVNANKVVEKRILNERDREICTPKRKIKTKNNKNNLEIYQ